MFDALGLADVPNLKDKIEKITLFQKGKYSNRLQVLGRKFQKHISKKLIKGLSAALTQAPENMQIVFSSFQLPHKRFWRLVFAMRHIKNVEFDLCDIIQMGEINDQFHIDLFGI